MITSKVRNVGHIRTTTSLKNTESVFTSLLERVERLCNEAENYINSQNYTKAEKRYYIGLSLLFEFIQSGASFKQQSCVALMMANIFCLCAKLHIDVEKRNLDIHNKNYDMAYEYINTAATITNIPNISEFSRYNQKLETIYINITDKINLCLDAIIAEVEPIYNLAEKASPIVDKLTDNQREDKIQAQFKLFKGIVTDTSPIFLIKKGLEDRVADIGSIEKRASFSITR